MEPSPELEQKNPNKTSESNVSDQEMYGLWRTRIEILLGYPLSLIDLGGRLSDWGDFVKGLEASYNSPKKQLEIWEVRNSLLKFRNEVPKSFVEEYIQNLENGGDSYELYRAAQLYKILDYPDNDAFWGEFLNRESVWANADGSKFNLALERLTVTSNPEGSSTYIRRALEKMAANRLGNSYSFKASISCLICLENAEAVKKFFDDLTNSKSVDFGTWLKLKDGDIENIFSQSHPTKFERIRSYYLSNKNNPVSPKEEKERMDNLKQKIIAKSHTPTPKNLDLSAPYYHEDPPDDEYGDTSSQDDPEEDEKTRGEKIINFNKRFLGSGAENLLEMAETSKYPEFLKAFVLSRERISTESCLDFLNNKINPAILEQSREPSPQDLAAMLLLARAHAELSIKTDRNSSREEWRTRTDAVLGYIENQLKNFPDQKWYRGRETFYRAVPREGKREGKTPDQNYSSSMDPFLIYHHKFGRARVIPDYRDLLAEKVRFILADWLAKNLNSLKLEDYIKTKVNIPKNENRGGYGPMDWGQQITYLVGEYEENTALYSEVEGQDVPVYLEAKHKLDIWNTDKCVVFGRDGRYLFTALKADDFGIDNRTLKYLIITRKIGGRESSEKIARYLKQNGVSLDFHFLDTGYEGSIPKTAIDSLITNGGPYLEKDGVDKKILLLSSRHQSRRQLSDGDTGSVSSIENRKHTILSPKRFILDGGRLKPEEVPAPVTSQLRAWTTEHAVMRNLAPRLEGDKMSRYVEHNPLKDWTYVEDLRAQSIGTHPLELWRRTDGSKEVLIKGGPEHTLRAEFVGGKLFELLDLPSPRGELIKIGGELRYKMDYFDQYRVAGINLPFEYQDSGNIQKGFLADMLLGQYDRTPWNIMIDPNAKDKVLFIDHGGCLTSRARGGYKGFPEHFSLEELKELLKNPQFEGRPVNEAYANLVEVRDGKLFIPEERGLKLARMLTISRLKRSKINALIDEAGYKDGKNSVEEMEQIIKGLEKDLGGMSSNSSEYKKTREAIETFRKAIEAGGEATYLKKALWQRLKDIVRLFNEALVN